MFLVCDKVLSSRALELRGKIYDLGYPCAVGCISEISRFMPLVQIITFTDVFDDVRRTPYDHVRVLALGETGFVNSALNAKRMETEELLFAELDRVRKEFFHVKDSWLFRTGLFYDDGIYLSESDQFRFITVYSNIINFSDREYRIFKYIQAVSRLCAYVPAEQICQFSYPYHKIPATQEDAARVMSTHISYINRNAMKVLGYPLIENKRFQGYRLVKLYDGMYDDL